MDTKDSEFLKRIQATFRIEADEHIQAFAKGLSELEKMPVGQSQTGIIEILFREVHSLKGAARSVGQKDMESVCQPLENVFSKLKRQELHLTPAMIDLFFQTNEFLSNLVLSIEAEQTTERRQNLKIFSQQLNQITLEPNLARHPEGMIEAPTEIVLESEPGPDLPISGRLSLSEVVRIPISKLEPLLFEAEEFIQANSSIQQQTNSLIEIHSQVVKQKTDWQNWRIHRKTAAIAQHDEWLEKNELWLINLETQLAKVTHTMERDHYSLDRMVNDHLDSMKQVLMLPVSFLVEVFPSMVREIARRQQKEIKFVIQGSELEIDKRILEELKDPLIHLIRNSIDHGIDTPEERLLQNKSRNGKITLAFTAKENGQVEITVSDDGRGILLDRVLDAAIKSEIVSSEVAKKLDQDEILSLIFQSGLSTSPIITDLSGRGLGLTIVREKVEKLNGILTIETKETIGTTFRILLPMNLAAFRGILVSLGDFMFMLPTMNVERVLRVKNDELKTIEGHETIRIDEDLISVVSLAEVLKLPESKNGFSDYIRLLVLISGQNRMAFKVEEVLDEHQVLVKGLGKLLKRVRNISGVTILGSGILVPVLHVSDLLKSAVKTNGRKKESIVEEKTITKSKKILVAEDSITSRTLLKNILETAGYHVVTAVDGADAFTRAKSEKFDLIVSDVDMPRLNGFELTIKIKNDKKLCEIPVVLVTALESRDDKERGIEAGADAYIIKSKFDQGNLLEVIKKLI